MYIPVYVHTGETVTEGDTPFPVIIEIKADVAQAIYDRLKAAAVEYEAAQAAYDAVIREHVEAALTPAAGSVQ